MRTPSSQDLRCPAVWRRLVALSCLGVATLVGCSDGENAPVSESKQAITAAPWAANKAYQVGDLVSFGGNIYRAIQSHTSLDGWTPTAVPALWAFEGVDTGSNNPPVETSPEGGQLTLDYIGRKADCDASPTSCCAPGSIEHELTEADDTFYSTEPNECLITEQGRDTIFLQSPGASSLILGVGDDVAMDGPGDDFIWAGYGNDTINAYGGTNLVFGGYGSDVIHAANGTNTVIPGPGLDVLALGTGNDNVYILDLCEVEWGEQIFGGTGFDTLYAPVSREELAALGVSLASIERVIIQDNRCLSQCADKTGCDACQIDSDDDETPDCRDYCRFDPEKTDKGTCGCGVSDEDLDGDSVPNCEDECPQDPETAKKGDCGCPSDGPEPQGTACYDGLCAGEQVCDGAGTCGAENECLPDPSCTVQYWPPSRAYYVFCDYPVDRDGAQNACASMRGGKLATLPNSAVGSFASAELRTDSWIAVNAPGAEGDWYWGTVSNDAYQQIWSGGEDGRSYFGMYNNWEGGVPSGAGSCAVLSEGGKWEPRNCGDAEGFICEVSTRRTCVGCYERPEVTPACDILGYSCFPWGGPNPDTCVDETSVSLNDFSSVEDLSACESACETYGETSPECASACTGAASIPAAGSNCAPMILQVPCPDGNGLCDVEATDVAVDSLGECHGARAGDPYATCERAACGDDLAPLPGNIACSSHDDCPPHKPSGAVSCTVTRTIAGVTMTLPDASACEDVPGTICDGEFCVFPGRCSNQYSTTDSNPPYLCVTAPSDCNESLDAAELCAVEELCDPEIEATLDSALTDDSTIDEPESDPRDNFPVAEELDTSVPYPPIEVACGGDCDVEANKQKQAHPWCHLNLQDPQLDDPDEVKPGKTAASDNGEANFSFEPNFGFDHFAEFGPFGIPDLKVTADAGVKASAKIGFAGNKTISILNVGAHLEATECGVSGTAELDVLGKDFFESDLADQFELPLAFPDEEVQTKCGSLLDRFQAAANRAKKAMRDVLELKRQYEEAIADDELGPDGLWIEDTLANNFSGDFCKLIGDKAPGGMTVPQCSSDNKEPPETTINRFIDYYTATILGFEGGLNVNPGEILGLNEMLGELIKGLRPEGQTALIDENKDLFRAGETLETTIISVQFFIGPIPCFLEVFATTDYGAVIEAEFRIDPVAGIEAMLAPLPANQPDEVELSKLAYVGLEGAPYAGAGVGLFAGVGFGFPGFKVQLGIRGDISLGTIRIPAYVGAGLGAGAREDVREEPIPTDIIPYVDEAELLIPSRTITAALFYSAGLGVDIENVLSGTISAQLKLKLLFWSKTWRKQLLQFNGLCPPGECHFDIFDVEGEFGGSGTIPAVWGELRLSTPFPRIPHITQFAPTRPASFGVFEVETDRAEEFFYDSLCAECIPEGVPDLEAGERQCFRDEECCGDDLICFDDPASSAPNECLTCRTTGYLTRNEQTSNPDDWMFSDDIEPDSCRVDSDCCGAGLCVNGLCQAPGCQIPCSREEECVTQADCRVRDGEPAGGQKYCVSNTFSSDCSEVK